MEEDKDQIQSMINYDINGDEDDEEFKELARKRRSGVWMMKLDTKSFKNVKQDKPLIKRVLQSLYNLTGVRTLHFYNDTQQVWYCFLIFIILLVAFIGYAIFTFVQKFDTMLSYTSSLTDFETNQELKSQGFNIVLQNETQPLNPRIKVSIPAFNAERDNFCDTVLEGHESYILLDVKKDGQESRFKYTMNFDCSYMFGEEVWASDIPLMAIWLSIPSSIQHFIIHLFDPIDPTNDKSKYPKDLIEQL